jgi:hypothetical protein
MFDNTRMLELIESALEGDPFCPICGAPTTIVDDDGRLWLVCSASTAQHTFLGRLAATIRPHERQLVVDLAEHRAA